METNTINEKLSNQLEMDLDICMESMLNSRNFDTMEKCLKEIKETYKNHDYYKGLLDEYKLLELRLK